MKISKACLLKIDILTLFPHMFDGPFKHSIIGRVVENNIAEIKIHDLRDWGTGTRKTVDDRPYGGGVGMILRVDVVSLAIKDLKTKGSKVVVLSPSGKKFTQEKAKEYSKTDHLIIIAGRYEGFDERIIENFVDEEISIGDYVLTGGEIPAMVIVDSVLRLLPGAIPKEEATQLESFSVPKLVEYPQYSRPEDYKGLKVPEILLTGDHKKIEEWKKEKAIEKTKKNRPDLI